MLALGSRLSWTVEEKEANLSLFEFISKICSVKPDLAESLIEFGCVHVNGIRIKNPEFELKIGEKVDLYFPSYGIKKFYELNPERIIYRDEWIIAYNKECSIPSHQVPYDDYNHVLAALRRFLIREGQESQEPYVVIHNRLDVETSGVLLFSTSKSINKRISRMFIERKIKKAYLLWAEGIPPKERWVCKKPISKKDGRYFCTDRDVEGKPSETRFTVLYGKGYRSLVIAEPVTGRTHQIRLHVLDSNLRIYGDKLYGGPPASRLMLHGWRMELIHPITKRKLSIEAPIPEEFFGADFCDPRDREELMKKLRLVFSK